MIFLSSFYPLKGREFLQAINPEQMNLTEGEESKELQIAKVKIIKRSLEFPSSILNKRINE